MCDVARRRAARGLQRSHTGVGVHFLGVYPTGNLVIVHRVDTEFENDFQRSEFYRLFSVIFGG